jgi:hypothetical protein
VLAARLSPAELTVPASRSACPPWCGALVTRPGLDGQPEDVHGGIAAAAEEDRAELAAQLRLARDEGGEDPLLSLVQQARDRMLAAERDLRLLLAYAREFAEPRPYRLEDLARTAGMSISGIRTAYDDDEIAEVTAVTGLAPRRRNAP